MTVSVRAAVRGDAPAIGAMLARAFATDPVTSWATPTSPVGSAPCATSTPRSSDTRGIPFLAEDDPADGPLGAAVWVSPGWRAANWHSVPLRAQRGARARRDIPRMTVMGRAVARARPRTPHWYLQLLGVDPTRQGQGVGSALVRDRLAAINEERPARLPRDDGREPCLLWPAGFRRHRRDRHRARRPARVLPAEAARLGRATRSRRFGPPRRHQDRRSLNRLRHGHRRPRLEWPNAFGSRRTR
ncbi:MAG: GNAT family N-acetyltransferase [Galbitalea sp.]